MQIMFFVGVFCVFYFYLFFFSPRECDSLEEINVLL